MGNTQSSKNEITLYGLTCYSTESINQNKYIYFYSRLKIIRKEPKSYRYTMLSSQILSYLPCFELTFLYLFLLTFCFVRLIGPPIHWVDNWSLHVVLLTEICFIMLNRLRLIFFYFYPVDYSLRFPLFFISVYVFLGKQNGIADFLCNLHDIGLLANGKYMVIYVDHMPYNVNDSFRYFKSKSLFLSFFLSFFFYQPETWELVKCLCSLLGFFFLFSANSILSVDIGRRKRWYQRVKVHQVGFEAKNTVRGVYLNISASVQLNLKSISPG